MVYKASAGCARRADLVDTRYGNGPGKNIPRGIRGECRIVLGAGHPIGIGAEISLVEYEAGTGLYLARVVTPQFLKVTLERRGMCSA